MEKLCGDKEIGYGKMHTSTCDDERYQAYRSYLAPPKNRKYDVAFMTVWQDISQFGVSVLELAANADLALADYKLLLYLMARCEFGNRIFINPIEIAEDLNVHRATIYRAVRHLCELKVLEADKDEGRVGMYSINPAVFYRGDLDKGISERKKAMRAQGVKIKYRPRNSNQQK